MDFNFKSKLWAWSIYHQFESICQDVDGFVNKDAVKLVGNQVQSVGMSVKRLYSDVVQDILPLSGDTRKPERQLAAGEQVDMQDRVSIAGTRTTSTSADEMQLAKNQVSDDHKVPISNPADVAEGQSCQYLREQGNVMAENSEDSISAEKNIRTGLKPVTANSSFDGESFSAKSDEDISSSLAFSAHEEGSTSTEEGRRDFNHQKGDEGFSDDTMCLLDTSGTACLSDDHKVQISKPADVAEGQSCQYLRKQGNVMVQNSEDSISTEKNIRTDLKPVTANSSFDGESFPAKSDEDISSSLAFSAHEEGFTSIEEERRDINHQNGDEGFSDDTMCRLDTSGTACLSDSKLAMAEDPYLDVPVSTDKVNQDTCPLMDSPLPTVCDVDDGAQEKYGVDLSTPFQSSEHVLSSSCDEKEEQVTITPSTFCTSLKSSVTTESTSADIFKEAANVLHSSSVSDGCTYDISAASSIKVDVDPAFPMMESNDNNALHTNISEFVDGSFESGHEEHYKNGHSKIVISPSETENTYGVGIPIGDLDLENVDLSSNAKHDGRSSILYSNIATAGSYRRKNLRYYKKLIKGAFTSRKMLTKEYEQLAIMYGDIDVESNQHFKPSSLSSFPNTALHAETTHSSQETSENEWELL